MIAESGKQYALKYVQPVSASSTQARAQAPPGSAQHSERARRELGTYANRVHRQFAGQDVTLRDVGGFANAMAGCRDATRRAKIKQRGVIARFLRQFPEFFDITSTTGRGLASVEA